MIEAAKLRMLFVADTNSAETAMDRMGTKVSGLGSAIQRGFGYAAGALISLKALQGLDAGLDFVADATIQLNDRIDNLTIGFTNMLHGADNAKAFMNDLAQFAIATPLSFDKVALSAQQLLARGFEMKDLIPLINDMGNAAAGLGTNPTFALERMTTALGQMNTKSRIQTQEFNQLAEAGVPALQILADKLGVTEGEAQKMIETGTVASGTFINAFHEWSQLHFGDMMEKQSHTFSGSIARIEEALQFVMARGFRPFFDITKDVTDQLANFLTGAKIGNLISGMLAFSNAVMGAGESLAGAFKENGIQGVLSDILQGVLNFAQDWFGAGVNLALSFADGLISGFNNYITAVVNSIADYIAGFFVGNSPPPEGPLSDIDMGGYNTMAAWIDGMEKAVNEKIPHTVDEVRASFDAMDPSIEGLQGLLDEVDAAITTIARAMDEIAIKQAEINIQVQEVTDYWDAQIEAAQTILDTLKDQEDAAQAIVDATKEQESALQDQISAIKDARDYTMEMKDLNLQLQDIDVRRAMIAAMGDPNKRAEIEGQLAALGIQSQLLDLSKEEADIKGKLAGKDTSAGSSKLDTEIEGLKIQKEKLQAKLAEAKTDLERRDIQNKIAKIDEKITEDQAKKTALGEGLSDIERQQLELRLKQIDLQKQELQMVDQEGLAKATTAQDQLQAQKDQLDLDQRQFDLKKQIAALPLEQQMDALVAKEKLQQEAVDAIVKKEKEQQKVIDDLKDKKEAALKPLEDELHQLDIAKSKLDLQRMQWQLLKKDIEAVLDPLKEAAKGGGGGGGGGKTPGTLTPEPLDLGTVDFAKNLPSQDELEKKANEYAQRFTGFIVGWLKSHAGQLIGGAIGGVIGEALGGPLGAAAGSLLGARLGAALQKSFEKNGINAAMIQDKFHGIVDKVIGYIERIAGMLEKAFGGSKGTILHFVDNILKIWHALVHVERAGQAFWLVIQGIIDLAAGSAKFFGDFVNLILDIARLDWKSVGKDLKKLKDDVAQIMKGFAEVLMGIGLYLFSATKEWLAKLWGQIKGEWPAIWSWIKDNAIIGLNQLKSQIETIGGKLWDLIKTGASDAWDWIKQAFSEGKDAVIGFVKTLYDGTVSPFQQLWDWIKQTASDAWGWVKQQFSDGKDAVIGFVLTLYDGTVTPFQELWDWIKQTVSDAWDWVKTQFSDGKDAVIGFVQGLYDDAIGIWDTIKQYAIDAVQGLWDKVAGDGGIFQQIKDGAIGFIQGLWDKVVGPDGLFNTFKQTAIDILNGLWTGLVGDDGVLSNLKTDAIGKIQELWDGLVGEKGLFNTLKEKAVNAVTNLYDGILGEKGALATFAGDMAKVASDAISGFLDGLGADWILKRIKEIGEGIWNALPGFLKKVLQEASPSKVMHDIGYYAMEGFANGLDAGMGLVTDSINGFLDAAEQLVAVPISLLPPTLVPVSSGPNKPPRDESGRGKVPATKSHPPIDPSGAPGQNPPPTTDPGTDDPGPPPSPLLGLYVTPQTMQNVQVWPKRQTKTLEEILDELKSMNDLTKGTRAGFRGQPVPITINNTVTIGNEPVMRVVNKQFIRSMPPLPLGK